jgi:hypothetical protein
MTNMIAKMGKAIVVIGGFEIASIVVRSSVRKSKECFRLLGSYR